MNAIIHRRPGDIVALRYVLTDGRIEMCWPCRVVRDDAELLALFIAAGSRYKAGPKRTAAEKRARPAPPVPPDEYVWRADTLRLMFPGRSHSVSLFWQRDAGESAFTKYFVNIEEPFRRTSIGFDTQDHTLDVVVQPDLSWAWRDEGEFENHLANGFFTAALVDSVRAEAKLVVDEMARGKHAAVAWTAWSPNSTWDTPVVPTGWNTTPPTFWERRSWAYGVGD
jgi:predicted RNA-binding protein associated with RNAse of E/G family